MRKHITSSDFFHPQQAIDLVNMNFSIKEQ